MQCCIAGNLATKTTRSSGRQPGDGHGSPEAEIEARPGVENEVGFFGSEPDRHHTSETWKKSKAADNLYKAEQREQTSRGIYYNFSAKPELKIYIKDRDNR
jgi:hypothetical protein